MPEVRETLADERLRRVDQQDRRLDPSESVDELGLLPGVLEVVAGVRLVRGEVDEVRSGHREVGVDVESRAPLSLIPVVCRPGLATYQPKVDALARREPDGRSCAFPECAGEPLGDRNDAV